MSIISLSLLPLSSPLHDTQVPSADLQSRLTMLEAENRHLKDTLCSGKEPPDSNPALRKKIIKLLYVSLVRCHIAPLFGDRSLLLQLESVQRRATRFIVNNRHLSYKKRLTNLALLLLMMQFEVTDILFFVKLMKNQNSCFPHNTRQKTFFKLRHAKTNSMRQLYFNKLPRLWNSLP